MGMSASQARFLMLTARKNNVEFEGQQINQQRTTLSNESAAYYSELCNMVVPTPPSIDDFTKVTYTFDDGALKNTITTMIARNDGKYSVNYIQQWQDDYSIVSASSSMIAFSATTNQYKVGSTPLRQLGQGAGNITQNTIVIDGKEYTVEYDENNKPYVNLETVGTVKQALTDEEVAKLNYFQLSDEDLQKLQTLDFSKLTMEKEDGANTATFSDGTNEVVLTSINKQDGKFIDPNTGAEMTGVDESKLLIFLYDDSQANIEDKITLVSPNEHGDGYEKDVVSTTYEKHPLTEPEIAKISTFEDPYLSTLTAEQVAELLEQEEYYRVLLNEKCFNNPKSDQQWYVRYVKDPVKGNYVPFFYNMEEVNGADYPADGGFAHENINCYSVGSTTKTKEVINELAAVEKDSTGRYIALLLFRTDEDGNEVYTRYTLTTNTSQDEEAYNDAMNKYNYAQFQYDQKVQDINSKIEIIQQQDKSLELELKHLDTEESAISTEMEAVKKVISKNIESSFKTFNA
jgi:hypothetical protein